MLEKSSNTLLFVAFWTAELRQPKASRLGRRSSAGPRTSHSVAQCLAFRHIARPPPHLRRPPPLRARSTPIGPASRRGATRRGSRRARAPEASCPGGACVALSPPSSRGALTCPIQFVSETRWPDRWQDLAHENERWRELEAAYVAMITKLERPPPVPAGRHQIRPTPDAQPRPTHGAVDPSATGAAPSGAL